jgi:hypothetical protein
MKHLKIQCYYYNGNEIIPIEQDAYIQNDRLYVGAKRIEYPMAEINYEIRDINGTPTLIVVNPMFKKIALQEFSEYLFKKTPLYQSLQELKEIAEK